MSTTVTTDATENTRRRERRYLRWFAISIPFLIAAVVWLQSHNRRDQRVSELASELQRTGGQVYLRPTLKHCMHEWWDSGQWWWNTDTAVIVGDGLDSAWIQRHGYLSELGITVLETSDCNLDIPTIRRLIECHPIRSFRSLGATRTDELVGTLANRSELVILELADSDLTDDGLRRLPLEQLEILSIERASVTPDGLQELHRCTELETLTISACQFDEDAATMLANLPRLRSLYLYGPGLTDELIPLISECQNLKALSLIHSTLTRDGSVALDAAMPGCVVDFRSMEIY